MSRIRLALSLVFLASALFHLNALVLPGLGVPVPAWQHALFAHVDMLFAAAVLYARTPRAERWLGRVFQLFAAEQICEHTYRATLEHVSGPISMQNLAAVAFGVAVPFLWAAISEPRGEAATRS